MIDTLVQLLLLVVILGCVVWLIRLLPLPAPWGQVAQVVAVVILLLVVLGWFLGMPITWRH